MAEIDSVFKTLRVNLRNHGITISEDVFSRFHPATIGVGDEICVFCNSTSNLTKEHIIPKWLFERDTKSTFISSVNRQTQSYNKAVLPACSNCNNSILAKIEKHIIELIEKIEIGDKCNNDDLSDIIRWLEIIDYKTQVYDCRRKYIKYGQSEYDPNWGILPVAHLRHFIEMNPFKAFDFIRRSQRRIIVKSKINRIYSLAIFRTTKPHFNFFTQPDEYVYISFPMYKISVFYFLRNEFENYNETYKEALHYIEKVLAS